jgi:outer membrane protein OmpA-like peptidoglycan-associated protein
MDGGKGGTAEEIAEQWRSLHQELLDLRAAIHETGNEAERAKLLVEYHQKRDAIKALEHIDAEGPGSGEGRPDEVTDDEVDEIAMAVAEAAERARLVDVAPDEGERQAGGVDDGPPDRPDQGETGETGSGEGDPSELDTEDLYDDGIEPDDPATARSVQRSPLVMAMVAVCLFAFGIAAGYSLAQNQRGDELVAGTMADEVPPAAGTTGPTTPSPEGEITGHGADETDQPAGGTTDDGVGDRAGEGPADLDGAVLIGDLGGSAPTIRAVVPNQELATALGDAIAATFDDRATHTITVDHSAPDHSWLAQLPSMIRHLPLLIEGSVVVDPDGTTLTGTVPSDASIRRLSEQLDGEGLPPVDTSAVTVTDLEPSTLRVTAENGIARLEGALPHRDQQDQVLTALDQLEGVEDIVDDTSIDPGTYALLDAVAFSDVISAFTLDGSIEVALLPAGFEARVEGLAFESGSDRPGPGAAASLDRIATVLNQSTGGITIVGHTDDVGQPAGNESLSERRAKAVADGLTASGVDPDRITTMGVGESEPVATNSTAEGQARNRRVMVIMGLDQG